MRRSRPRRFLVVLATLTAAAFAGPAPAATYYSLTILREADRPFQAVTALGINASGQVVGGLRQLGEELPLVYQPYVYSQGTFEVENAYGTANAINDLGVFVGESDGRPFISDGSLNELNVSQGRVFAVNNAGLAAGSARLQGIRRAVRYEAGEAIDLGALVEDGESVAYAINDAGVAVGWSLDAEGDRRAVRFENGAVTPLDQNETSAAFAINATGQAVGISFFPDQGYRSVRWDAGGVVDLGAVDGFDSSTPLAINASGFIVGSLNDGSPLDAGAFVYDGTTMFDLQRLIIDFDPFSFSRLLGARDINDAGQIVGTALDYDGNEVAYLLTPEPSYIPPAVPEPSVLAALLLAASLLLGRRLLSRGQLAQGVKAAAGPAV